MVQEEERKLVQDGMCKMYETEEVDQEVNVQIDRDLTGFDWIPNVIKCLKEFSGKASEYGSWRKSVARILNIYVFWRGTPKYVVNTKYHTK
jgi:hypothetical protein